MQVTGRTSPPVAPLLITSASAPDAEIERPKLLSGLNPGRVLEPVFIKDRLITLVEDGKGEDDIDALRKNPDVSAESLSIKHKQAMTCQVENLQIALSAVISRYLQMSVEEKSCLLKIKEEGKTAANLDELVTTGYKFALVTTFIHQKYHDIFPDGYVGVAFKPETTCKQLTDLPYSLLLSNPGYYPSLCFSQETDTFSFCLKQARRL